MSTQKFPTIRAYHLISFALILLTLIAFCQVLGHQFVNYDDPSYVTKNERVKTGLTLEGIAWAFTTGEGGNWHPLTWISHALDCQLFGLNPAGHHLTNLLLHTASTVLLFVVLREMSGFLWQSAFVAALFAIHPLHVESVAWVSERKDVLSAFFWMLTLWAYSRYVKHPSLSRYGWVLLFFIFGLMSKPMVVTLPFVLLLLDIWPLRRHFSKDLILEKTPLFLLTLAGGVMAFFFQDQIKAVTSLETLPLHLRLENALVSYVAYLGKMIWPLELAVLYPHPGNSLPLWKVVCSGCLILGISIWSIRSIRKRPYLLIGWLWYLGTLLPVIGIIQVGKQAMADRYTYIPMIGISLMISWGIPELIASWRRQRWILGFSSGIVLLLLTLLTWRQVGYWRNSDTLFKRTIHLTKNNYLIHNNLGVALANEGRFDEAIEHYRKALQRKPDYVSAHINLGIAFNRLGKTEMAIHHYSKALQINPKDAEGHGHLAAVLAQKGEISKAIHHYSEALKFQPNFAQAHNNLGILMEKKSRYQEAFHHYSKALNIHPNHAEAHYNLGRLFHKTRKPKEAERHYHEALRNTPGYLEAHINLGGIYLQSKRLDKAIHHYSEAIRINPSHAGAHYSLGLAHHMKGKINKAIHHYSEAIKLKPGFKQARGKLREVKEVKLED